MDMDSRLLGQALTALGEVLETRGESFELVAVGGSALLLLGSSVRPTKDLDVLAMVNESRLEPADPLPAALVEAVKDVGAAYGLAPDWVNPGPTSLLELGLPVGFEERLETHPYGPLIVHVAARKDQICFKLYAGTDMGPDSKHIADLKRLEPTKGELVAAANWVVTQDPSSDFRAMLYRSLEHLGVSDARSQLQ